MSILESGWFILLAPFIAGMFFFTGEFGMAGILALVWLFAVFKKPSIDNYGDD
jgi:hypothetical protein